MKILKTVKSEFGGGRKPFSLLEPELFIGVDSEQEFLSSAERQSIILYFLNQLRANSEDLTMQLKLREGEAIGNIFN